MCWNATVSLNTFILGVFAIAFALFNGVLSTVEALYYALFVSMQLVEYFAWNHLKDRRFNALLSRVGYAIILLLPLAGIVAFSRDSNVLLLLVSYLLFALIVASSHKPNYSMSRAPNGHLAWHWLQFPTWVVMTYFIFWLSPYLLQGKWILVGLHTSVFLMVYASYLQTSTWGSMWCWVANLFSFFLIASVFQKELCSLRPRH